MYTVNKYKLCNVYIYYYTLRRVSFKVMPRAVTRAVIVIFVRSGVGSLERVYYKIKNDY